MFLAYTRVSTVEQASSDRTSLSEQSRVLKGLAMMRGVGEYDTAFYSDPGISGSCPLRLRPGGGKLLAAMQPGDVVAAAKLDRMFRSAIDALRVAEKMQQRGIALILCDMGDQPVTGDGMAKCFFTMAAAFAELERTRIADRMREGKTAKRLNGGHGGGVAPYGWQIVGEGRQTRLEPVEAEQATIRIVKAYWPNHSPQQIRLLLENQGLRDRAGSPFRPNQVQRIAQRELA